MKILMRNKLDKNWNLVETAAYGKEAELQRLLAESPGLISISEVRENASPLVLAVREFSLSIGSIDLLAFSSTGDIAIIECKLASNPEVKRKVIGQVLEYGANLWQMSYEDLDQGVRLRMGESLAELVEKTVSSEDWDEENFRSNIEEALANGNFILIIVVDEINEELTRIVRYMNNGGNQSYDFAALEMRRYQNENAEMLIPRFFGPSHITKTITKNKQIKQWDELTYFSEMQNNQREEVILVTRKLLEWSKRNTKIYWGKGKQSGAFVPIIYHKDKKHQLFAVWTTGSIELYFYWYSYKYPFDNLEKRIEILIKLNQIDRINLPMDSVNKRPSIQLEDLAKGNNIDKFLAIYDWVVDEIKKR